jgi:hypothetical protein
MKTWARRGSALGEIWALTAEGSKLKGTMTVWTFQLIFAAFVNIQGTRGYSGTQVICVKWKQ